MTASTTAPIKRALVRQLRSSVPLMAAIAGGIHQAVAPKKVAYPFVVYSLVTAPRDYQQDGFQYWAQFDVFAFAVNPVDAENVDSLVAAALEDAPLAVTGQELLYCRRISDTTMPPAPDKTGRRIFQVGGTYRIVTDQPL